MLRIGFTSVLLALAACAAPATDETAPTVEDTPGVRRGSEDATVQVRLSGDADGYGEVMHIEISRPIVFSVGGVRVEHESLCGGWMRQIMDEIAKHDDNGVIDLNHEEAEEIVRSIPLPPGAEMSIRFEPVE
jgi:hypothetical protein